MASFRLILLTGLGAGTEYPLEKSELFLGRDLSNDIVINDPEVSRRHARLLVSGLTYTLEDLGSTNGTFVRGQRLGTPITLIPGEVITIGEKVTLKFEPFQVDPNATVAAYRVPAAAAPAPAPAPAYTPPQQPAPVYRPPQPQPAAPVYTPPQPAAPVYQPVQPAAPVYAPVSPVNQVPAPAKKKRGWLIALIIVLGIILLFCVIPTIIIDVTNSWCAAMPGILNMVQPGACP